MAYDLSDSIISNVKCKYLNVYLELERKDFGNALKYAATCPIIFALYNLELDFDKSQVISIQVSSRGGGCFWRSMN
ncbi:hypothetical protein V1478_015175 [Vespula squamosa]|uniref:Uncharacterized protein n=1 Tax=Vespula squamosa TaxID=30214 RepID=A0ABD2A546_VESSQ